MARRRESAGQARAPLNRSSDLLTHPLHLLRARLADDFTADLPKGVEPVAHWCRDPQFFPGATGLLTNSSWADVVPGGHGFSDHPPPARQRGVVVLGNYQATAASYQRILDGSIGGFAKTWSVLGQLLVAVDPRDVFLTNAYIGVPDLAKDTAPFPTTPSFIGRCQRLLVLEIELFNPRLIVCLGVAAAKMLASITDDLEAWRPWPGYTALRSSGGQTVANCRLDDVEFAAVAVRHPSAVISNTQRQADTALVTAAASAPRPLEDAAPSSC
ncbi:MAG: hypothetical protein E6G39_19655 [Actinobacteria bacterium]|nr:MAG: hypothetical protein E6G39_19655 [Actinomycetota bacterium]